MTHNSSNIATRSTATAGRRLVLVTGLMVFAVAFCGIFQCPKQDETALTEERLLELVMTTSDSLSSLTAQDLHARVRPFWEAWKVRHGYTHDDDDDDDYRLGIFVQNAASVAVHNAAYHRKWTLYAQTVMASPFAHLTASEFAATHLMESQNCSATAAPAASTSSLRQVFDLPARDDLPSAVDWRTRGILTPVKNQKHCGSCWTFSTTGTLEAHTCLHASKVRHDGPLDCPTWTGLAEQQLLDCAWAYDNHGCNGGLPSHAFEYLKHAGGMATENDYPYKAVDSHECHIPVENHRAHVAAVYNISNRDEDDLVAAVAHMGPVSIAYEVSPDFRLYSHGVYDSYNATTNSTICSDDNMSVNHAVVAVGYGVTLDDVNPVPYYIVRNSWSASWGMEGHFWMLRGKNLCGVSDCASFPLVPANPHLAQFQEHSKQATAAAKLQNDFAEDLTK